MIFQIVDVVDYLQSLASKTKNYLSLDLLPYQSSSGSMFILCRNQWPNCELLLFTGPQNHCFKYSTGCSEQHRLLPCIRE